MQKWKQMTKAQEMEERIRQSLEHLDVGQSAVMPWGETVTLLAGGVTKHLIPLTTSQAEKVRALVHADASPPSLLMSLLKKVLRIS